MERGDPNDKSLEIRNISSSSSNVEASGTESENESDSNEEKKVLEVPHLKKKASSKF